MKILYIVQRFHTNLYWRFKALREAGHEVFVLANKEVSEERRSDDIKYFFLKPPAGVDFWRWLGKWISFIYFDFPSPKDLKNKIKEINPDVIVARNLQSLRTLLAFFFADKKRTKLFVEAQTEKYSFGAFPRSILIKTILRIFKIKGFITPLKNRLLSAEPFFKYLPFVMPAKGFDKKYFAGGKINIITVGKYIKRKDHFTLLEAIKLLRGKHNIALTIVGQWNNPETEGFRRVVAKKIKNDNLADVVRMEDNLPNEAMEEQYRAHDLFVLPAYNEPASYSVLEAMAAKLPVIASDDNGTSGYIKEGENGYIFKNKDAADLAAKIEAVISDKEKLIKMGAKSFELARENHSLESFSRAFEKIAL